MLLLVVSFSFLQVSSSLSTICENGWTQYRDKCYYFSDRDSAFATRDEAIEICRTNDAYLVAVTDEDINNFLYSNRRKNTFYWIGLVPFANGTWGWNNGIMDDDIPWQSGEPNEDFPCARIKNADMYDKDCNFNFMAICERDTPPDDSRDWVSHGGHWYLFIDNIRSQLSRSNKCISIGGYLARITGDGERNFIETQGYDRSDMWIGLTKLVWDDGSGYNWNFWKHDHPTNTGCVVLDGSKATWRKEDCDTKLDFICSKDVSYVTPKSSTISTGKTTTETTSTTTTTPTTLISTTIATTTPPTTTATTAPSLTIDTNTTQDSLTTESLKGSGTVSSSVISTNNPPTERSVTNSASIEDSQLSPKNTTLNIVLYVIWTLVVIVLVTDLALLMVFLKLKKRMSTSSKFDNISSEYEKRIIVTENPTSFENQIHSNIDSHVYASIGEGAFET